MFTTAEDFQIAPYRLPNLDADQNFAGFINQEEAERLKKLLGRTLYNAFIEGLYSDVENLTQRDENDIAQRWKDLRDGVEYTYGGYTYYWEGMNKMLKPYIYSKWITHDTEKYNGSGGVNTAASENATVSGPAGLIVRAFNEFAHLCGNECRQEDTLYGYLFNSGETFVNDIGDDYTSIQVYMSCKFQDPGNMNIFNI
jgi:hypothetical protein